MAGKSTTYELDGGITITCSNVDRVVFTAVGITKGDLIAYYRDVATVMLPELVGRPLTLERYTKGLAGGGFYQKHFQKHFPDWIHRVELRSKTPVIYPTADDRASLVYFANQGAIAFHIGTSRREAPDKPDLLIFDLDPPESPRPASASAFDLAKRAAFAVREVLEEIDMPAFVKTTGGKGLHVVAPVDGKATYQEAADLLKRINLRLCERHPETLTTAFYKKDRNGRLFLDVLRNGLGATVVAPWSVRGKPTAPVSAPVWWEELESLRSADAITLREVRERLDAKGNPWAGLRDRVGSIESAIGKLPAAPDATTLAQMVADGAQPKRRRKTTPKRRAEPKAPESKREPI